MSDKRFELYGNNYLALDDNVEEKTYYLNDDESIDLLVAKMNALAEENESLNEENAKLLSERIKDLEMFEEVADKLESFAEENKRLKEARGNDAKEFSALYKQNYGLKRKNEQLRRYVYHCPQICNIILAYLRKSETEDVKAVSDAMGDDKYFDEEIDTLRSWE